MDDDESYEEVEEIEEIEEDEEDEEYEEYEETDEEVEEDEEGGSEEELEDQLKYERLKLDFLHTKGDAVSCMAVGSRFLIMGTQLGWIYVVDFVGNVVNDKRYHRHDSCVTDISIDPECDFVGSCSTDGRVYVGSIFDDSPGEAYSSTFDRPVCAIAIDPHYAHTPRFVTGGLEKKLILVERGHWGPWKTWRSRILDSDTGKIHAIQWRGDLIAWADDTGVKVIDVKKDKKIVKVAREKNAPLADMYRCALCWETDTTLLISWANWLAVCVIKKRPSFETARDSSLPEQCGEVTARFIMPSYFVSGIAPFGKKLLMLTYPEDTMKKKAGTASPKPELRILNRVNTKMNEIEKNSIKLEGYERLLASDYRLAFDDREERDRVYYILSPKEIVVCKPCDIDDRINWLLRRNRFEEAMKATRQVTRDGAFSPISRHTYQAVGEKYLAHLVDNGEYAKAAELLPEVLGNDADMWKKWVVVFQEKEQLTCIADVIPVDPSLKLGLDVYESALHYFLWREDNEGPAAFYRVIQAWPCGLYDTESIINSTQQRLSNLQKPTVLDPPESAGVTMDRVASPDVENADPYTLISLALALLFESQDNKEEALHIHLELGRSDVFDFIDRHKLHYAVEGSVVQLLWKNQKRALKMLVQHHKTIRVSQVVQQLQSRKAYLYRYLDQLHKEDSRAGSDYHDLLVTLYAKFDAKQLLPFLRQASLDSFTGIRLDKAAEVCEERLEDNLSEEVSGSLYRAQAFVLGRLGGPERKRALEILISKIKSVKESIDFIVEHDDEDLFEALVQACLGGGQKFVADLLEHIGDAEGPTRAIEPLDVIGRIRPDMAIPGLKEKLTHIIRDQALRKYLKDGCLRVLQKDACALDAALYEKRSQGTRVVVDSSNLCPACQEPLRLRSANPEGVAIFLCGHSYHHGCYHSSVGKQVPPRDQKNSRAYPSMRRVDGILVRTDVISSETYMNDPRPRCPRCVSASSAK
eukprot:TRINITY_DN3829_c5_g1_i1.p1 TRINITY_DN3829_c5_g1~~TRINITY_DN3829_c5_g1_i1.p1  ORF type:complete len:980 (+),score=353.51 TRINITY_DN3829_c5_g1_i1:55-2994(+)